MNNTPDAFDAWFTRQFPDVTDDETNFDRGEIWDAWQAGRASEREHWRDRLERILVTHVVSPEVPLYELRDELAVPAAAGGPGIPGGDA